ncbi:MAG: hypothetical protein GWN34_07330, partial [Gammaproteobacteria bacterium]|nr:hypothetical protein [Gammaproteobacteria bacterium]
MTSVTGDPKTAAPYVDQFAQVKGGLPGNESSWLRELREEAIGRFSAL